MGPGEVQLPPDLPNWYLIKELLLDLHGRLVKESITDQETGWFMQTIYTTIQADRPVSTTCSNPLSRLMQTVYSSIPTLRSSSTSSSSPLNRLKSQIQSNVKKKLEPNCVWYGMLKYLKSISKADKEHFLYFLLPSIIKMALRIEDLRPREGLFFSRKQNGGTTALSRQFVCSVVACFFLCLFQERVRETTSDMNIVNFTTFFKHLQLPSQVSKLRCILHYFECVIERGMTITGSILFTRKVVTPSWILKFDELTQCEMNLCPVKVFSKGVIEDSGAEVIQVDFANQSIGGGVLGRARVQEEIKFCVCPELMSAMLFMENMEHNEAISVSGFEQFSCYTGYADSLEFAGHYNGNTANKTHRMVAIDALSYRDVPTLRQYEETFVMRDLNKALIGFCRVPATDDGLSMEDEDGKRGAANVAVDVKGGTVDVAAGMVTSAICDAFQKASERQQQSVILDQEQTPKPSDHKHHQSPPPHLKPPCLEVAEPASAKLPATALSASTKLPTTALSASTKLPATALSASTKPTTDTALSASTKLTATTLLDSHKQPASISGLDAGTVIWVPFDSPSTSSPAIVDAPQTHVPHAVPIDPATVLRTSPSVHSSDISNTFVPERSISDHFNSHPGSSVSLEQLSSTTSVTITLVSQETPSMPCDINAMSRLESNHADQQIPTAGFPSPLHSSALASDSAVRHDFLGMRLASDILGNLTKITSTAEGAETSLLAHSAQDDVPGTGTRPVASDSYSKVTHFTVELPQLSSYSLDQDLSIHFHTQPNEDYSGQSTTCCLDSPVVISEASKALPSFQAVPAHQPDESRGSLPSLQDAPAHHPNESRGSLPLLQNTPAHHPDESRGSLPSLQDTPAHQPEESRGSLPSLQDTPAHQPDESRGSYSPLVTDSQDYNSPISTDMLYVNVDNLHPRKFSMTEELGTASFDSALLGPPSSLSPQSSLSSSNVSPNTSFTLPAYHQPRNGSSDVHVTADFFIPDLDNLAEQFPQQQRGSRDFYGELREFLSSSSSGTRSSGSGGGPNSSSNSTWGSRSGSISSHGTNGSSNDFLEFWNHLRRRSSQFSDTTSRRSSSSKHSSDFSTDLEEISESLQKHCHGVIEEEGGILTMLTDYASQMVTSAVRNGVATGVDTLAQPGDQSLLASDQETPQVDLFSQPAHVPKNASTQLKHGKTFSRAGTLVRQEKVNLEVDDTACKIIPGLEEEPERDEYSQSQDSPPKSFYDFHLRSSQPPNENLSLKSSQPPNENVSLKSSQPPNENLSLKSSQPPNENVSLKSSQPPNENLSLKSSQPHNENLSPTVEISVVCSASIPSPKPCSSASSFSVLYSRNAGKGYCQQSADSGFVSIQSSVASMSRFRDFHAPSPGVTASDPPGVTASDPPGVTASGQPGVTASGDMTRKVDETTSTAPETYHCKTRNIPVFKLEATAHHKYLTDDKVPEIKKDCTAARSTSTISKPNISVHYVNMPQEAVKFDMKQSSTQKIHRTSHAARVTSHGTSKEIPPKSIKSGTSKSPEWPAVPSKQTKVPKPAERDVEAVSASSTESIPHLSSGASGPTKSSGIPKFRSSSKKSYDPAKCSVPDYSHGRGRQADKPDVLPCSTDKEKVKMGKSKKQSARERDEKLFRAHRSRYVFSDVAAPPRERRSRHPKEFTPESPHKRQGRGGSKKNEEKRRPKHTEEPVIEQARDFTKSPKFIRFVNTLAEISLSQAVLEGAEIVSQTPFFQEEISDEVYNWFANKIITEVFFHVISEIETRDYDQDRHSSLHLEEIGASGGVASALDSQADSVLQPLGASARDSFADEAGSARPKCKGILPSKSDTAASGVSLKSATGLQRSSGSLKMVKFKEGVEEDPGCSSSKLAYPQALYSNHSKATAFQRMASSSIPVPVRRRSSLDLPLTSPPTSRTSGDLSAFHTAMPQTTLQPISVPGHRRRSLTNAELSLDAYQAAASIVNQVFQTISDSMDVQALSPGSSCYHGTISSSDTGAHSTGSRIHSHYDSFASNIFSSSSMKAAESPRRARRSVSPSIGLFFRKPMSRETLTNAYLKVDHSPQIKTYERRSSEPCQTSVTLSLQAFNNNKFNGRTVEEKMKKLSRTDDDIGCGKTWRRGSLDGYSFDQRRNSCGFKDPVLSRFAEELMKADTSVPELVIVGSHASSSSTGSRRSSVSAFRDSTLANLENELLNTSFTSACSVSQSSRSHRRHPQLDRSRSRDSRQGKSDSSETEYWFPPPKFVGDEFQLEYNRQHSQEELQDYASYFAGRVVQEAVCVLRCDPDYMSREEQDVDMFAENLTDQIMRDALMATVQTISSGCPTEASGNSGSEDKLMSAVWSMSTSNKPGQGGVYGSPTSRALSKPRSIPQRKDSVPDISGKPHSSYSHRIRFGPNGERRSSSFSVPPPQQYLHPTFKPTSEAWGGARPKSSRPSQTAGSHLTPTQTKRHSSPSPFQFCSSVSYTSPSTLQVPSKMSPRQYLSLEMRSKSESGPRCSNRHLSESQHWKKPLRKKRAESHSSVSSVELGSDETCSSFLSSSSSSSLSTSSSLESIGPVSHADTFASHIPTKRAQQTGHSGPQQPSNPQAKRSREEKSDDRAENTRDLEQSVEKFADNLCSHVVTEALQQCKKNKWLRFVSYRRPIATGNWGCGAYQGNPQLKFVMQWIAGSVARSPLLIYYSFGDPALTQIQDVTNMMSGLTVGQLASTLREYCNWVCFHSTPSSLASSHQSSSKTPTGSHLPLGSHSLWQDQRNSQLPQPLFDFLLEKFSQRDAKR